MCVNNIKKALIVGAGEFTDREINAHYDLVVAADAGLGQLLDNNVHPDVIIGDFDSLGYVPDGTEVIVLPVEKDMTDLDAAIRLAWERGCRDLTVCGATGGNRIDHFLGNMQLGTEFSQLGAHVRMLAPDYSIYFLTDDSIVLHGRNGAVFSVLSQTTVSEGVSILGDAKYKICEENLGKKGTLSLSNEICGNEIRISVKRGTLSVFLYE